MCISALTIPLEGNKSPRAVLYIFIVKSFTLEHRRRSNREHYNYAKGNGGGNGKQLDFVQ